MNQNKEYGIKWNEINKNHHVEIKQKFFKTNAARERFVGRLLETVKFNMIIAWSDPR